MRYNLSIIGMTYNVVSVCQRERERERERERIRVHIYISAVHAYITEMLFIIITYLYTGQRLSLIFLQYFNNYKISFEAGFIRNVQNFQTLLQNELHRETKAPPALPFAEHTPRRNTKAVVKIQSHASPT